MTKTSLETITDAQRERLAYMSGECAEVIQAIAKIQRRGYHSYDPTNPEVIQSEDGRYMPDNVSDLERELGHVFVSIQMMFNAGDINVENVFAHKLKKFGTVQRWLHHQPPEVFGVT